MHTRKQPIAASFASLVKSQRAVASNNERNGVYAVPVQTSATRLVGSPDGRGSPSHSRWESPLASRQRLESHEIQEESHGEDSLVEQDDSSGERDTSSRMIARDNWAKKPSFKLQANLQFAGRSPTLDQNLD